MNLTISEIWMGKLGEDLNGFHQGKLAKRWPDVYLKFKTIIGKKKKRYTELNFVQEAP